MYRSTFLNTQKNKKYVKKACKDTAIYVILINVRARTAILMARNNENMLRLKYIKGGAVDVKEM